MDYNLTEINYCFIIIISCFVTIYVESKRLVLMYIETTGGNP